MKRNGLLQMKAWKILLPTVFCLILAFFFVPAPANAEGLTEGIYTYKVTDGVVTITGCDRSTEGSIAIPSKLGGYPVVAIGDSAFAVCDKLTEVTIPEGVTHIGERAFSFCERMDRVTIPDTVTKISLHAFYDCYGLSQVDMGNSVTEIGEYAFSMCLGLTELTIPDSVTVIKEGAFSFCENLREVTLGKGIKTIELDAFYYCEKLTRVTLRNNVESIGKKAFYGCDMLSDVYFYGTETQWQQVTVDERNHPLLNATFHFGHPNDLDADGELTTNDAVYLLLNVMFGSEDYPVSEEISTDFNGDGAQNTDDAVYLLLHVMFGGTDYPLPI